MKLDYSKTLNEQRDTIENILNENKHYSLQLSQLQQDNENLRTTIKNDDIATNNLCNEIRQLQQEKEELIECIKNLQGIAEVPLPDNIYEIMEI